MSTKQKIIIAAVAVIAVAAGVYFFSGPKEVKKIEVNNGDQPKEYPIANEGPVSPISGLSCENWNKRPVAVMQPADPTARPAAGFSDADMVFEMPVFTNSNTRLMGVYVCNVPDEIGSMRSGRHDYIPLAKGLDAIYVHWGYSKFAQELLKENIIDNIDCLTMACPRWPISGTMKLEDTGYISKSMIDETMEKRGYRKEGNFSGYPHQGEIPLEQRSKGGNLRLAYPGKYDVEYDYDKDSNSYLRTWDGVADTDKNNGKRVAPKNIVVMVAKDAQIKLADEQDYINKGLRNPWSLVPKEDQAGLDYGGVGRYNNLQMGDPWFDTEDSGEAFFYLNGNEYRGTWKKDKSRLDSKLLFYNNDGQEIKFVPGQIWVNIMEPGQGIKWTPAV